MLIITIELSMASLCHVYNWNVIDRTYIIVYKQMKGKRPVLG